MNENWMGRLAFLAPNYEDAFKIRDELMEINLFDGLSFNIENGNYWIYLKPVSVDKIEDLNKIIDNNNYRLVRYRT